MSTETDTSAYVDAPWPDDTPDVRLGGLILTGSSVDHVNAKHDDDEGAPDEAGHQRDWSIYCIKLESDPDGRQYALVGDLFICTGHWHVQVTALTPLQLRGDALEQANRRTTEELTTQYGPWAAHVLYDYVAQHARALATNVLLDLRLPFQTPMPDFEMPEYLKGSPAAE